MGIALPEFNGQRFLRAIVAMKEHAVIIRDQTGDLTYRTINDLQRADAEMRMGLAGLQVDAQAVPAKVLSYLQERGLTATSLADAATKVNALSTAMTAWQGAVWGVVTGLSGAQLIEARSMNSGGETLVEIVQRNHIAAADAAPLRSSSEIAAVITALEALGA